MIPFYTSWKPWYLEFFYVFRGYKIGTLNSEVQKSWIIVCEAINTFYFYKFFETLEQINSTCRLHGSNPLGIYQLRLNNKDIRTAYMFTCKRYLPTENKHSSKITFFSFPIYQGKFPRTQEKSSDLFKYCLSEFGKTEIFIRLFHVTGLFWSLSTLWKH